MIRGVKLTLGSNVIGRIDTNSYYTDGSTAGYTVGLTYAKNGLYIMGPNGNASTKDQRTTATLNPGESIEVWPAFYNGSAYVWGTSCVVSARSGGGGSSISSATYWVSGTNQQTAIAYQMGTSTSNLVRLGSSGYFASGYTYGVKITCGTLTKYYWFDI